MLNEIAIHAIERYYKVAIQLGVMTLKDHELVMKTLRTEAEDEMRNTIQLHLDQDHRDGTKCTDLVGISKLFILTKDLWAGQYTVGAYIGDKDAFT